jgi:hypothetical protein
VYAILRDFLFSRGEWCGQMWDFFLNFFDIFLGKVLVPEIETVNIVRSQDRIIAITRGTRDEIYPPSESTVVTSHQSLQWR